MWRPYVIMMGVMVVVAVVGARATDVGPWYRQLNKPWWNPPDWAFPVVWTTIYITIIASVGMAWNSASSEQRDWLLVLLGINMVLNMAWSVVFFLLKRPAWALLEVLVFWVSIVALIEFMARWNTIAAGLLSLYLIWVTIAACLNASIVLRNPGLV